MENYEILKNIELFENRLKSLENAINIEGLEKDVKEKEDISASPSFYDNMKEAQATLKELKKLKDIIQTFNDLVTSISDLTFYYEMQKNGKYLQKCFDIWKLFCTFAAIFERYTPLCRNKSPNSKSCIPRRRMHFSRNRQRRFVPKYYTM